LRELADRQLSRYCQHPPTWLTLTDIPLITFDGVLSMQSELDRIHPLVLAVDIE
jgi:hypothetical protein